MSSVLEKFNFRVLTIGHAIFHSTDYAFDYVLYPFVIYKLGPFYGGVVMAVLATTINLSLFYIYDSFKKDWLGIEIAKEMVENFFKEEKEIVKKSWRKSGKIFFYWLFHRNKLGQFIFLSLHFDPLITVIYMRPGHHLYNGLSKRDWKIFWSSVVISNAWWTGIAFVAISTLKGIIMKFF